MNSPSSPSIALPSRPLTERVLAALGLRLRLAQRSLLSRWHHYRLQRREARLLEGLGEMNAHLLRDIGAPDRLIERAVEIRRASRWREIPFQLSVVLVGIALAGTASPVPAVERVDPRPVGSVHAPREMVGAFTGEFVDGAPVYRFPTVVVGGSRRAEPARSAPPWRAGG